MKIGFVEWPEGLCVGSAQWQEIAITITELRPDILVTNELPFGRWIADEADFCEEVARQSIDDHQKSLEALSALNLPAVISSRPVWYAGRLANEAFVLENGHIRALHRKRYFPNEAGWHETQWYVRDDSGFELMEVCGIKVGALLCTEAMFNEYARSYGKNNADLIVIPRASGLNQDMWKTAGKMASTVSGAYVVSSNRLGVTAKGTAFGGGGFAIAPQGQFLSSTNTDKPICVIDFNKEAVVTARTSYPCYVSEF